MPSENRNFGVDIRRLLILLRKAGIHLPINVSSRIRKYASTVGALTPHSLAIFQSFWKLFQEPVDRHYLGPVDSLLSLAEKHDDLSRRWRCIFRK